MSASNDLFVYGTLRLGADNDFAKLLARQAYWVGRGRARGQLFMVQNYPGFVRSEPEGDWVLGDVYSLHSPQLTYVELDRYEGCGFNDPLPHEYCRSPVPVLLDSGQWVEASAYLYALDISDKRRITSGDYLSR